MERQAPELSTTVVHQTPVNLTGLMQVISKHLYSTPIVAIRELVQNAHDAIIRRRIEQPHWQQPAAIHLTCDSSVPSITLRDNGSGLTEDEIHRYLATVGIGYTRQLRQEDDDSGLIGMFGLGFASAFVLSEKVTFTTTSWQQPEQTWRYCSTNGESYSVEPARVELPGTTIALILKPEMADLADEYLLSTVLSRYCALLHEPVFVGDNPQAINALTPPWRRASDNRITLHPALVHKQQLEFAARFEPSFTPLCVLPVTPNDDSDAAGILWLQDGATYGISDNRHLSLFLRGMLIDSQARELLPPWAGFVGGVIESNHLTPTASREDLQRDDRYLATHKALTEALITGLANIAQNQPEIWRRVIARHNEALLGAALCDERLFSLLKDELNIPTSRGDMPVRSLRRDNTLMLMTGEDGGFEGMLLRLLQHPVARGDRYAVVPFLRRWAQTYQCKLVEIGTRAGNQQFFNLHTLSEEEQTWWQQQLAVNEQLIAARFEPSVLPLIVIADQDAQLKKRLEQDDADKRISTAALMLARKFSETISQTLPHQLYLNFSNPAIQALSVCWKQGKVPVASAITLLRSLKIIMAAQMPDYQEDQLHQALDTFSQVITRQVNNDVQ